MASYIGLRCVSYMISAIEWAKQFKEPNTWNAGIALKLRLHLDLRIENFFLKKKFATIIQQHIKYLSLRSFFFFFFQSKALVILWI